jgi:hypothetical protein
MQTNHTDLAPLIPAAKNRIRRTLATQEPCTFEQILFEMECSGIDALNAMPVCILALAEMIKEGTICGWDEQLDSIEDPADYAWVLSEPASLASLQLDEIMGEPTNEGLWVLGRV